MYQNHDPDPLSILTSTPVWDDVTEYSKEVASALPVFPMVIAAPAELLKLYRLGESVWL